MAFSNRRSKGKKGYKKTYYKKATRKSSAIGIWFLGKLILFFILILLIVAFGGSYILYQKYITSLPDVNELENLDIAEASIIYDREGNELYKVFEEKRVYKDYSDISPNIINALVAGEDKRYWENPGIDFIGLTRAVLYRVIGRSSKLEGTSTITQQLVRNMIITNERTAERKVKEMYLAYKLTNSLDKQKIIELYLNKISFGSNAFGIEQAAQTFFGKRAADISVLEASMLASLPKGPTYYSPYNNYERLVGYPYIYQKDDSENIISLSGKTSIDENTQSIKSITDFITSLEMKRLSEGKGVICGLKRDFLKSYIAMDGDGCSVIDYSDLLVLLNAIRIENNEQIIEYQTGRKDFILGRMLEDSYIDFDTYKESLLASIGFEFKPYKEDIKYPHFVFYVKEFLEEKYGKEILETGGLRIYTSIDPDLQDEAEKIVEKHAENNEARFGAQNAAMVSLDNETGQILAMVGGRDYFDEENKGNVNIITSRLQPGSTFKPFVYSMAIDKEIVGSKTPIYDVKTTFPGGYAPNNFDGEFQGKMNVSTALNESRNIPAVKMYYLAGGEKEIDKWMANLGVESLEDFKSEYFENYGKSYNYGSSMSLGTGMMTPLELARAYSVYANMGFKKDLVPVLKIYDSKGNIIEEFKKEQNLGKSVIDPSTAFITNHILSDNSTRPEYWNQYLTLTGRKVAAKTGTSTKQFIQNGEKIIQPRNLWTIGYTPQVTTVSWAGNNDGTQTNLKGNGLEGAGPIWQDFMKYYHDSKPNLEWKRPGGVKEVDISKLSGMLPPKEYDPQLVVSSLFINAPKSVDAGVQTIQVDTMCNGLVEATTPVYAIGDVDIVSLRSLRPEDPTWELPVQSWIEENPEFLSGLGVNDYITSVNNYACQRSTFTRDVTLGTNITDGSILAGGANYIEIGYRGNALISKLDILLNNQSITQIDRVGQKNGFYSGNFYIPSGIEGKHTLTIKAVDTEFFDTGVSYEVVILAKDTAAPTISLSYPLSDSLSITRGESFDLKGEVKDTSEIRSINIYIDDVPLRIGLGGRSFSHTISSENLQEGDYTLRVEAVDSSFNKSVKELRLSVTPTL